MELVLRRQLAALARSPQTRRVGGPDRPHRWRPGEVPDAETGYGMTDAAAWALLASKLEDPTQKLEQIELRIPPMATGYVMKVAAGHLDNRIYIKFEFIVSAGCRLICARSFHIEAPR